MGSIRASTAGAAVLVVTLCSDTTPGGAPGELRRAITDAASGDTVQLPACQITLTGADEEDANATRDLDVAAKAVFLRGAGRDRTILDGGGADRVLHLQAGGVANVSDLTIRGGRADLGGGVWVTQSSVLDFADGEIRGNEASAFGGGLLVSNGAVATVRRTAIAGNQADVGGGVVSASAVTILDSTVAANEARTGGGLVAFSGTLHVEQSTVSGNRATGGPGGGILVGSSTAVLWSTVTGNTAVATGGGLFLSVTVATIGASIVVGNDPGDCGGPQGLTSLGHNLQGDGSCPLGSSDGTEPAPGLGPLAPNGGPTLTHALGPGSPALDAGPETGCPGTDQRGVPRPQPASLGPPARCDIGAVERRAPGAARGPAATTAPR